MYSLLPPVLSVCFTEVLGSWLIPWHAEGQEVWQKPTVALADFHQAQVFSFLWGQLTAPLHLLWLILIVLKKRTADNT